jgi:putative PIN family toxin of toxin-antitoxin system
VLDTNVLVSALLKSGSPPSRIMHAVLDGSVIVVLDERILDEYRQVLARPKLAKAIDGGAAAAVIDFLVAAGEHVTVSPGGVASVDPKDTPFLEVALAASVDALVTGNAKDFPADAGIDVCSPTELVARMDAGA